MTVIEQLVAECSALGHEQMPGHVRAAARHSVLDWTGCAVAGQDEPLAGMLRDEVAGASSGAASLIGRRAKTSVAAAALVNGAGGHALDFDDTNLTMRGHPTAAVLPAVLALAEEVGERPGAT